MQWRNSLREGTAAGLAFGRRRPGAVLAAAAALGAVLLIAAAKVKYPPIPGWDDRQSPSATLAAADRTIVPRLTADDATRQDRYHALFDYFLAGILAFRTEEGARIHYPGQKGIRGHDVEGLEGFARVMPLPAAWIASGRPAVIPDPDNPDLRIDLAALIREGLLAGTDSAAASYWGDIRDFDQRAVEAADIALVLWLTRDTIWSGMTAAEQAQVVAWLGQMETAAVTPNNWLLFRTLTLEVLAALGTEVDPAPGRAAYAQFKEEYREAGWFFDPPKGVDFYNAWAITYALHWIDRVNPDLDPAFLDRVVTASGDTTLHLIGPEGIPLMGRSPCYRLAVPAPVILAHDRAPTAISAGEAARALDAVWTHYAAEGALVQGTVTQGIYGEDLRFLDRYSGPGSCLWSVRSLVAAYSLPPDAPFWSAEAAPLPVERKSYTLAFPDLGWTVTGDAGTGEIRVAIDANDASADPPTADADGALNRFIEALFDRPFQPNNYAVKYGRPVYSSADPYGAYGGGD